MPSQDKKRDTSQNKVIMPFGKPDREFYVDEIKELEKKPVYDFVKRAMDIVIAVFGIVVFILPMAVMYIAIALTSEGAPIYKQERLGLNGKKFYIYKFRTMYTDAEKNGAQWSRGDDDERITPVGRFLRRFKFDELPQLFNCIKGDVSFVGPRPEREIFYDCFESYVHGFHQRLLVKPGITGLAQITGGYYLKPEEKIVYDMEYIRNRSILNDIKILLQTVFVVLKGEGSK